MLPFLTCSVPFGFFCVGVMSGNEIIFNDPKHLTPHTSRHRLFAGVRLEYTVTSSEERITSTFGRPLKEKLTDRLASIRPPHIRRRMTLSTNGVMMGKIFLRDTAKPNESLLNCTRQFWLPYLWGTILLEHMSEGIIVQQAIDCILYTSSTNIVCHLLRS